MRPQLCLPAVLLALSLAGCDKKEKAGTGAPASARSEEVEPATPTKPATGGPHFTEFPGEDTPAADFVKETMADHEDRTVLVYVGATWCEPCRRFHDAVEAGELDETFPDLELVEFDLDEHKALLTEAGYASRLVPLFSVPNADGRDQQLRIEGSIKGDKAVEDNLVPRLENLLARTNKAR